MSNANRPDDRTKTEQILDLLLDALLERQSIRRRAAEAARPSAPHAVSAQAPAPAAQPAVPVAAARPAAPERAPARAASSPRKPQPDEPGWTPAPPVAGIGLQRLVGRLLIFVLAVAVLINIPLTRHGVSLARMMPDSAALIVRDGVVLKGSGDEIYQLQDDKLRWISSMDAFDALDLTWDDVHIVDDSFLSTFERGEPIHVLVACRYSDHVYLHEGPVKRWIKDIPTFEAQGYRWEDIHWIECDALRAIPDGPPIPEDAGTPPQP
ncbi:MAG: hypothetical protein GX557_14005 [Chloroflexi bacterium]|nr:hypothetical protein [Chloroflexota bacterium]